MNLIVTEVIVWNGTLWTGSIFAARTKKLFQVVADEARKKGVATVDIPIAEAHFNAVDSSRFERLGNLAYTAVVEVGHCSASGSGFVDMFKFRCGEICQQNLSTL